MKKKFTIGYKDSQGELFIYITELAVEKNNTNPHPLETDIVQKAECQIRYNLDIEKFKIVGVLPGIYVSTNKFKLYLENKIRLLEEQAYEEQQRQAEVDMEEIEWNQYVQDNYDFEYGDWRY